MATSPLKAKYLIGRAYKNTKGTARQGDNPQNNPRVAKRHRVRLGMNPRLGRKGIGRAG